MSRTSNLIFVLIVALALPAVGAPSPLAQATMTKIPFLGDLPCLGSLFRLTNVSHQESEVVIIMTPRILASGTPVQ